MAVAVAVPRAVDKVGLAGSALRLRQETTLSLERMAERLHMGSRTYVSDLLNRT